LTTFFFTNSSLLKGPDPGSGSEIPDFHYEDPDPDQKIKISDPENCSKEVRMSGQQWEFRLK